MSSKFQHVKNLNYDYYTPFLKYQKIYKSLTGTEERPTPIDWQEYLNANEEHEYLYNLGVVVDRTPPQDESLSKVPGGVYKYESTSYDSLNDEPILERLTTLDFLDFNETILPLGDSFSECNHLISQFLQKEEVYKEVGTKYKLGLLLYGSQGQGKSVFIRSLLKEIISKEDAVVIYMGDEPPTSVFLMRLETALKGRVKVFIFEELTSGLINDSYASWLLTFLDGEKSPDKSIIIATTNYPEKLPQNIVNRPSRFDKIVEFKHPSNEDRKTIISHFMGREGTPEEIEKTKDYTVADIKEICLSTRINDLTFEQAISALKTRKLISDKQFQKGRSVGF